MDDERRRRLEAEDRAELERMLARDRVVDADIKRLAEQLVVLAERIERLHPQEPAIDLDPLSDLILHGPHGPEAIRQALRRPMTVSEAIEAEQFAYFKKAAEKPQNEP